VNEDVTRNQTGDRIRPVPNCDFYAAEQDILDVLRCVFELGDFRAFESYSNPGEDLVEFKNADEIARHFPLGRCQGTSQSALLQLYPVSAGGTLQRRRIDLKTRSPGAGAAFRFSLDGWGLIQLQLGGVSDGGLFVSHTNHNSEARALKWEDTYGDLGPAREWNWTEVIRASRRLNSKIRKLAVRKIGSRPVLPAADALLRSGVTPR